VRKVTLAWLLAWLAILTVFTLVPGVVLIATADPLSCKPEDQGAQGGLFPCVDDVGPDPLQQGIGWVLIAVWAIGFVGTLLVASLRQGRNPENYRPCPECGQAVGTGSPTCLGCGYNLLRSGPPSS
jgi:hypothetical protein